MASKPETSFIRSIHRLLPTVYAEKMCNPYRGGTADVWYSGKAGDLWIEYKWRPAVAKQPFSTSLSELQLNWLRNRFMEGRNVAVVIGVPSGGYILKKLDWELQVDPGHVHEKKNIAQWILNEVGESPCLSKMRSTRSQGLPLPYTK